MRCEIVIWRSASTRTDILAASGMKQEACTTARRAVAQWESIKAKGRLGNRDARKNVPEAEQKVTQLCRSSEARET